MVGAVRCVNGVPGAFEDGLEGAVAPELEVLVMRLSAGAHADPFRGWVLEDATALLVALQEAIGDAGNVAVVLPREETGDAWEAAAMDAAVEAVRAAMHSLTFELAGRMRLNVVVCGPAPDDGVRSTLAFLGGADGSYVAGSTFDLRSAA